MMNYLTTNDFDYSILDNDTAQKLQEKEYTLVGIHNRYSNEVGKVFYEAKEELANHYKGTFEQWYTALGFKTTNVYRYINNYKYTMELEGSSKLEELEIFNKQPKSLQNEMSKPSAKEKVNQKVYDGDITNHKQYKELENQLNQKDEEIANKDEQIKELENKPPEIKEVKPHDYDGLKDDNKELSNMLKKAQSEAKETERENKALREQYNQLAEERRREEQENGEKSRKYDRLNEEMKKMNGQLNKGQQKLKAQKEVYDLIKGAEKAIEELAPLSYLIDTENVLDNEFAQKPINKIIDDMREIADRLERKIDENVMIIEEE